MPRRSNPLATGLALGLLCIAALAGRPAHAAPTHALTISGAPALPADFPHLPHVRPDAPKGGALRLGSIGTFDSFHPFIMRGMPAAQISLIYETLGESNRNEDFSIHGLLAKSFELAPDRSWLVCRLHPDARFSDGKPVTADDVAFTFRALVEHGSPFYRDYYAQVAGVDVLDAHTVRFRFASHDNPELPVIVAQLPVLPAHWWQGRDFSAPQREPAPGSGPYRVREHRPGSSITYERVPGWWGANLPINRGRYNFDVIRCDYYRDVTVARQAFLGGEFDLWSESTIKDWAESYDVPAVRDGRIVREEIPHGRAEGMSGFIFNTRQPRFADVRVRKAVAMAFDFEWTNKALFHGAYLRSTSYFTNSEFAAPPRPGEGEVALLAPLRDRLDPAVFGDVPLPPVGDGSGDIRPRLREALALLREAGWELRDGALRNARGEQLRFTLLLSSKGLERVVLPYRRNLERLGIAMDVQVADQTQYVARIRAFAFDMMYATLRQSNSPGNEQRSFWTSAAAERPGSRNYAGIRDAAVDALVERIVAAPDRASLTDAVRALDRVLLHGAYVVPGWYSDKLRVAHWKTRVAHPATPPGGGHGRAYMVGNRCEPCIRRRRRPPDGGGAMNATVRVPSPGMAAYILRRLLLVLPTLLGIITVNFFVVQLAPGGPVEQYIARLEDGGASYMERIGAAPASDGTPASTTQNDGSAPTYRGAAGLSPQAVEAVRRQYGFDRPIGERYLAMLGDFALFRFGDSLFKGRGVLELVGEAMPVSLSLGLWNTLIIYAVSIPLGMARAVRRGSRFDTASGVAVIAAHAIPAFLLAVLLVVLFAGGSYFKWFPLRGLTSPHFADLSAMGKMADYAHHMMLPIVSMVIGGFAGLTALTRNAFLDELGKAYVETALAKGLSRKAALWRHVFRNAMLLVISGLPAAFVRVFFTGALLIETIFSLNGLGLLGFEAAMQRDYPVMFATLYVFTLIGLVMSLVGDVVCMLVDPRIDFERREVSA